MHESSIVVRTLFTGIMLVGVGSAAAADPWLGKRVFIKDTAEARIGDMVVDKYVVLTFPATVEEVNGDSLRLGRAWVLKSDVMDVAEALDYCADLVRREPTNAGAWCRRADCWNEKGELENAIKDYTEAIRLNPEAAVIYNNRGNAKRTKKDFDGAIQDYDEAIRLDPKCVFAYFNRAIAKRDTQDFDGAIHDYDEAIRFDPKCTPAYINRGFAAMQNSAYASAISDFDEAIRLDAKSTYPLVNKSFLLAACPDAKYRDAAKAIELANAALMLDPERAHAKGAKACALALQGDFDAAINLEEEALKDERFHTDKGLDGGANAAERIDAWKRKEPWFFKPVK